MALVLEFVAQKPRKTPDGKRVQDHRVVAKVLLAMNAKVEGYHHVRPWIIMGSGVGRGRVKPRNVVRINPWELHICDPAFFNQFYTSSSKLDKDPWYYNFAGIPRSTFATSSAAVHRQRRGAISKIFTSSPETSNQIEECVQRLVDRLRCFLRDSPAEPVRMSTLYWMFASDVVTTCMMPVSTQYMTHPGSAPHYARMFKTLAKVALWNRHFSIGFTLLASLPRCILDHTAGPFVELLKMQDGFVAQIKQSKPDAPGSLNGENAHLPAHLLASKLPVQDKTTLRFLEEINMIIGAGTEAVGAAISITTYYLLSTPHAQAKLLSELNITAANQYADLGTTEVLSYAILQQHCPYLGACIKEGLRLSKESNRLPRINRQSPTVYGDYTIPAGTVISMSLRDVHLDPSVFPSPQAFIPERWLPDHPDRPACAIKTGLENYLVPFGRGARACVGRAIAMEELYVTIGNLFYRMTTMQLWDTDDEDMRMAHDFFSGGSITGKDAGLKVMLE
ncbi:MAG: hypothetical protein Q9208_007552 [Pyrenodesmia sp. 3 TL-2023]